VPNTISPQELEDLHLLQLRRRLSFKRAGWIRPLGAGGACEAPVDDVTTCVLYAEIVEGHVKKFGTTGSVRDRQVLNRNTINNILAFQDGRYRGTNRKIMDPSTYDKFKQQAPGLIRDGKKIEIWATSLSSYAACQDTLKRFNAQCAACQDVEAALNGHYKTIEFGWATRLN
jgi:hypothetical protein